MPDNLDRDKQDQPPEDRQGPRAAPYDPARDPIAGVFRTTTYGNHQGLVVIHHELEYGSYDDRNSEWMGMCNVMVQIQTPQGLANVPRQYRFHIHGATDSVSALLNFEASLAQEQDTINRWVREDIAREQAAQPRIQIAGRQPARADNGRQHGAHGGR